MREVYAVSSPRLRDWTEADVWPRLHEILLAELHTTGLLKLDDAAVEGPHIRALKEGLTPGPSPVGTECPSRCR